MKFRSVFVLVLAVFSVALPTQAEVVIEDGGVSMSREELEFIVENWAPNMKHAAANNRGDRVELLNMALATKKIAEEAKLVTAESDPDAYWRHQLAIRNLNRQFVVQRFLESIQVPDMTDLAPERYQSMKKKYAFVPESRRASHILLMCQPGSCLRDELRPKAQELVDELNAGKSFDDLVSAHSQDPGTKAKGGVFDRDLQMGMTEVDGHFVEGVFSVEKVGGYSGVVESKFGFHIIRLDALTEEYYRSFEEVQPLIIADLESEYRRLAAKEFDSRFRLTGEAFIDDKAMDDIFAPYVDHALPK